MNKDVGKSYTIPQNYFLIHFISVHYNYGMGLASRINKKTMSVNFNLAIRHLWKNKLFSCINIIGLSLGLASCFIILLHVKFELGFDKFHKNKDRIVRVMNGDYAYTPIVMSTYLPDYFPEIEKTVRIGKFDWTKFYVVRNQQFIEDHDFLYGDSAFFNVFSFPILSGDPDRILRSPDRLLLSESTAKKYFGKKDPISQTLQLRILDSTYTFTIEGVFNDFPKQSHFHAKFMVSSKFAENVYGEQMLTSWGANSVHTYLLLKQAGLDKSVSERLAGFADKYVPKYFPPVHYSLQALGRIHLYSKEKTADIEVQGSITRVIVFASIAILVLVIAVVNFILLSLSLSFKRIKEFGIRKIVGARQTELVSLISAEFVIVFVLAIQISLMLVELFIPLFESRMNFMVYHGLLHNAGILLLFLAVVFLMGYMASLYIAASVSAIRPVEAIKSTIPRQNRWMPSRGVLVIFQFSIMIGLLVCLMIMQRQQRLIRNKDLGYRKEQLLTVAIPGNAGNRYQLIRDEFSNLPGIEHVSGANYLPPTMQWWISSLKKPGTDKGFEVEEIKSDFGLAEALGIELIKGRTFSREYGTDSTAILINEMAVKQMEIDNPLETFLVKGEDSTQAKLTIIGVFKDFHMRSLYDEIKPMAIFLATDVIQQMAVRLGPGDSRKVLKEMEKKWNVLFPDDPIQYTFVDEALHLTYVREDQAQSLISIFTFLSIIIALMGLFGLSANTVERRTKETGIRKVHGATPYDILYALSKQFTFWILISFTLAIPLSWYAMHRWLDHFAYRTDIEWWIFPAALLVSLTIAFSTIVWQTYNAAVRNPVEALRYE